MNLLLISYFVCAVVGYPNSLGETQDFAMCVRFRITRYLTEAWQVLALGNRELPLASMSI